MFGRKKTEANVTFTVERQLPVFLRSRKGFESYWLTLDELVKRDRENAREQYAAVVAMLVVLVKDETLSVKSRSAVLTAMKMMPFLGVSVKATTPEKAIQADELLDGLVEHFKAQLPR